MIDELNKFLTGWVAYFRYAQCKSQLEKIDSWVRRKLRCLRLKQCRFMQPIANWLQKLGVPRRRAWLVAQSGKRLVAAGRRSRLQRRDVAGVVQVAGLGQSVSPV